MEKTTQLLFAVTALAILAEVTYLVVKLPRQNISKRAGRPILVDTSVLIDGRIIAVAKSGFIGDTLVIPRSVIGELQFLADNADHDKRTRARYGLDVVKELQNMPHMVVEILQDGSKAEEGVDERLLNLAKKYSAAVCTIDYNLNKVAVVEGIAVLNVNELAQSLRMAYLPGEKMLLELVQKGQDSHQGVGYLTDGTMVVVENASKQIGQTVEIEFIRSLQTAAGKMMFAKPTERSALPKPQPPHKPAGKKPVREAQQPVQAPKPALAVYHSEHDKNVRQRPERKPQVEQRPPRPQQSQQQQPQRQHPKKSRTSADREASLIDLVDKQ
jgi:rRNA-processing protein FCF1